ncbi:hypothetical protein J3459_017125 [Metarhizium acridum]|uniref:SMODS and SLOG-associating 2TM effector domain-containing protein n=1 Tax=Metarhizium acridum (strain CQMa 102) TaxID=655827 RepID=E9DZ01_METAQ|nr:uncharacterized protein MAC_02849 [Metarhizium acridum CQMa 102]EFY91178.1 hypothetical protein MAC_02849 [Metarhizium acridum CQMa 102]KAG8410447.1 hypothetical protein J3459_017125 [Metarhizium acridum]
MSRSESPEQPGVPGAVSQQTSTERTPLLEKAASPEPGPSEERPPSPEPGPSQERPPSPQLAPLQERPPSPGPGSSQEQPPPQERPPTPRPGPPAPDTVPEFEAVRPSRTCVCIRWCGCYSRPSVRGPRKKRRGSTDFDKYWNATLRIYNESECEHTREQGFYVFTYWLVWGLVIAQLIISAFITGFTAFAPPPSQHALRSMADNLSQIPIAGLGGATFIITSLLSLMRTEPERRWRNSQEYRKVIDLITQTSETLEYVGWVKDVRIPDSTGTYQEPTQANQQPPQPTQPTHRKHRFRHVGGLIEDAFLAYEAAKRNVALNRPGDFGLIPPRSPVNTVEV